MIPRYEELYHGLLDGVVPGGLPHADVPVLAVGIPERPGELQRE
jgi:hypothetical protein